MSNINYKPEIDGLRTFAVFFVIIHHINPSWLPSGFIGVDIFLVISGFLITKIILKSHENNNFSITDFYARRVKRIIPLTYFLLSVIFIAGFFFSFPSIYEIEAKSVLSSLVFLANIRFALMGNYFNIAEDNPLLHLWSLSLEEQFYFIWPLFIIIFLKLFSKNKLFIVTGGLLIFSIILSYVLLSNDFLQNFAYFSLPTRMIGLLFGSMLAMKSFDFKRNSDLLSLIGLAMIILSAFFVDKSSFPNYQVLLPLFGCYCIIIVFCKFIYMTL